MKTSEMIVPIEIGQQAVEFNAFIGWVENQILSAFSVSLPRYGVPPMATLLPLYRTARDMGCPV